MLGMAAHTYNLSTREIETGNAECEAIKTHIKTRQVLALLQSQHIGGGDRISGTSWVIVD